MTTPALLPEGRQRYFNNDGTPAAGAKLYTYAAGTSALKSTYADANALAQNPNPITLDAKGEAVIFWDGAYKVDLKQADGAQVTGYPVDNIKSDPLGAARLFTVLGAGLVGYGAGTVAGALDAVNLADYAALRAYSGVQKSAFVSGYLATKTASGIAGFFVRDESDTTSADNGGTIIVAAGGARWKRVFNGAANVQWFGVSPASNDNTAALAKAFAACTNLIIPGGNGEIYRTSKYPRVNGIHVEGIGRPRLDLFYADTEVMVQFGDNSTHRRINFNSTEVDREWQRSALEQVTGCIIEECGFYGFRHANAKPNAWGIHVANATDCQIIRCDFANNSQSDIALTDNNRNITIVHPTNATDGGVYLDIEPNANNGTDGLEVIGGKFREVDCLENDYTAYGSKHVKFSAATITKLVYDGTSATFDDACQIGSVINENPKYVFAGNLNISLGLSHNLIDDPYLIDLASANPGGQWMADYVSTSWAVDRIKDAAGSYVRTNKNNANQTHWIKSKKLPVPTGVNPLLVLHVGRCQIPAGAGWGGKRAYVEYFSSTDASLGTSYLVTARAPAGTTSPMLPHWGVLLPPAGTTYVVIHASFSGLLENGGSYSTICDHHQAWALFEISSMEQVCNTRDIATRLIQGSNAVVTRGEQIPNTAQHAGGFVGDRVVKLTPAVGSPRGWVCTASGTPGTWVSEGVL